MAGQVGHCAVPVRQSDGPDGEAPGISTFSCMVEKPLIAGAVLPTKIMDVPSVFASIGYRPSAVLSNANQLTARLPVVWSTVHCSERDWLVVAALNIDWSNYLRCLFLRGSCHSD